MIADFTISDVEITYANYGPGYDETIFAEVFPSVFGIENEAGQSSSQTGDPLGNIINLSKLHF